MKRYILYLLFTCFAFEACSKKEDIKQQEYVKITVAGKPYINTPDLEAFVNGKSIGTFRPAGSGATSTTIPVGNDAVKLVITNPATGEDVLDSTFVPKMANNFTVLVDNDLGIRQFYVLPTKEPRPVSPDSFRVQLFHKIEYKGIKRTVTFKVFEDLSGTVSNVDMHELPIQVTVPYGTVGADVDIPYEKKANGRYKKYRVKAYDATTGEILVDIVPPFFRGAFSISPGAYGLWRLTVMDDTEAPTGLSWNFTSSDRFPPFQ